MWIRYEKELINLDNVEDISYQKPIKAIRISFTSGEWLDRIFPSEEEAITSLDLLTEEVNAKTV